MRSHVSIAMAGAAMLALSLGACNSGANAGAESGEDIEKAIKAQEAKWQADLKAKNTEGVVGQYGREAYFATTEGAADGSTAVRKMFAEAATDPAFKIQFSSDKIEAAASGDIAYSRGRFTEQHTDAKAAKVMSRSGSYLTVYKKQDDGSWQIVEDFVVPERASEKVVPPEKPAVRAKMVSF